jgi:hypothetical protein
MQSDLKFLSFEGGWGVGGKEEVHCSRSVSTVNAHIYIRITAVFISLVCVPSKFFHLGFNEILKSDKYVR